MLRSFFLVALRILWRNKLTSLINIFSLGIGMTAFILIMMYLHHEKSYDKFNENYNRIYRLESNDYARLPPLIGMYVKDYLPEVETMTRMVSNYKNYITYIPDNDPENVKQLNVSKCWADSTTFDVFTFSFIQGCTSSNQSGII